MMNIGYQMHDEDHRDWAQAARQDNKHPMLKVEMRVVLAQLELEDALSSIMLEIWMMEQKKANQNALTHV